MRPDKTKRRAMPAKRREALAAYTFLLPNFLGFLAFTSIPVVISLVMAFSHWNIFKAPSWVGLENFRSLLWFHHEGGKAVPNDPFFWQYVYNTVFLMAGIPVGMMGSLLTALVMNQKLKGIVVFRTVYFLPSVCSGVALLILWKYLYNSDIGLINKSLRIAAGAIYSSPIVAIPFTIICAVLFGMAVIGAIAAVLALVQWVSSRVSWEPSGHRRRTAVLLVAVAVGALLGFWLGGLVGGGIAVGAVLLVYALLAFLSIERAYRVLTILASAATFVAIGAFGKSFYGVVSSFFFTPPDWLGTVQWAKPSLMLMGLWGGLGGYNMILYLAALQGVPTSYYEAAEIDGAGPWQKFWAVTWPMISPTTFFILVMSVIGGFQGGFMTANVMTGGGPAGSTTTVEYYLYQNAFEKFNMGYASAIAWFLFAVILVLTLTTWKLGGRVVTYD